MPSFFNRRDTVYDVSINRHQRTAYMPTNLGSRTCYQIFTIGQPRAGQRVDAIDYSPDKTFDRTVNVCRCIVLTIAFEAFPASTRVPACPGGASSEAAAPAPLPRGSLGAACASGGAAMATREAAVARRDALSDDARC